MYHCSASLKAPHTPPQTTAKAQGELHCINRHVSPSSCQPSRSKLLGPASAGVRHDAERNTPEKQTTSCWKRVILSYTARDNFPSRKRRKEDRRKGTEDAQQSRIARNVKAALYTQRGGGGGIEEACRAGWSSLSSGYLVVTRYMYFFPSQEAYFLTSHYFAYFFRTIPNNLVLLKTSACRGRRRVYLVF